MKVFTLLVVAIDLASSSVFFPQSARGSRNSFLSKRSFTADRNKRHELRIAARSTPRHTTEGNMAMAIPGYGVAEQVFVGGFSNFLSIYNLVITGRILLSWFPQTQTIGALQPVFAITDPYLNLFRGIIPPIFGLDFSPILAFLLLNFLTSVSKTMYAALVLCFHLTLILCLGNGCGGGRDS